MSLGATDTKKDTQAQQQGGHPLPTVGVVVCLFVFWGGSRFRGLRGAAYIHTCMVYDTPSRRADNVWGARWRQRVPGSSSGHDLAAAPVAGKTWPACTSVRCCPRWSSAEGSCGSRFSSAGLGVRDSWVRGRALCAFPLVIIDAQRGHTPLDAHPCIHTIHTHIHTYTTGVRHTYIDRPGLP